MQGFYKALHNMQELTHALLQFIQQILHAMPICFCVSYMRLFLLFVAQTVKLLQGGCK